MANEKHGMLMVWTDIPAEIEPDFNEWYNREHLPDRINKVPGFVRARRFLALADGPKYLALYETESATVMRSEPYLAINRDPDPKSRRFIPLFKNTIKGISDVVARSGFGEGSFLAIMPISHAPGKADEFRNWVSTTFLPDIVQSEGVVAATYTERNQEIQAIASATYTRFTDRIVDSTVMIEVVSEVALASAVASLAPQKLGSHGATSLLMQQACSLRMLYSMHAADKVVSA